MQISKNSVVSISYRITDTEGTVLDHTDDGQTMEFIFGSGEMVPGLEKSISGKMAGDSLEVTVPAEEAFGNYDEKLTQELPKEMFAEMGDIEPGLRFRAETDAGMEIVTVTSINEETVVVDANHPLAGIALVFSANIVDVREATPSELEHGHVHGPEGCGEEKSG